MHKVTCPKCNQERTVSKVQFWRLSKGLRKHCKSCSLRLKTYPGRKNPGNDGAAISARMKGNSYAKGHKRPKHLVEADRVRMMGNKYREGFKGDLVWNWKGGITSADRLERIKFRRTMQKQIFKRDKYTCLICKATGNVQVDHIKRWSEYPDLRFEPSNCRTLCMACHYLETFGRKLPEGQVWGHNLSKLDRKLG